MKQPETLSLAHWLERFGANCQRHLDIAAELRRLHQLNTDMLEALQAGPSTFHSLPGGEVCQCSQCQFVRLRNAAIAKATGKTA